MKPSASIVRGIPLPGQSGEVIIYPSEMRSLRRASSMSTLSRTTRNTIKISQRAVAKQLCAHAQRSEHCIAYSALKSQSTSCNLEGERGFHLVINLLIY